MWIDGNNHIGIAQKNSKIIRLPDPHIEQIKIIEDKHRFKVLDCGRRFGKTTYLYLEAIMEMVKLGHRVAYLSPSYTMLLDFWNEIKSALAPLILQKSEKEKMLIFKNGGYFKGFSGNNPEVIRGGKYHLFLIDEAAVIGDLENIWNNIIRATLSDYEGRAIFASTPRGNNFFKKLYDRGISTLDRYDEYNAFKKPTWHNPFLKRREILKSVMDVSEKAARQEIMAEFLSDAGSVFIGVTAVAHGRILEPYSGNFVMAVDLARKNDYTVACIYDCDINQIVDFIRFNSIKWGEQVDRLVNFSDKWKVPKITVEDNNIGDVVAELLEDRGLDIKRFTTGKENKRNIIEGMVADIQWNRIVLPEDPLVISEFQTFESKIQENGHVKYGAGTGFHDDIVMSFCIARHAALGMSHMWGGSIPLLDNSFSLGFLNN